MTYSDSSVGLRRAASFSAVALLAAISSACASPSARITTAPEGYGFQPSQSQCVGDRLEANLSLGQLQELGRAARAVHTGDTSPGRLTAADFIRVAGQVRDPKVSLEVAKASAGCGIVTGTAPF